MNDEWKAFLVRDGARVDTDEVLGFGDMTRARSASLAAAALVDLSGDYALIRASGVEALGFLNGQLTNDLRTLDDRHHLLAAYCNPQGRAITLLRIWREADEFLLLLPASLAQAVLERLRRYILRAKVSLELDTRLATLGLIGPKIDGITNTVSGAGGPVGNGVVHAAGQTILAIDGIVPRYMVVLPIAARIEAWTAYRQSAVAAGHRLWQWHDIQAGQPNILPPTSEAFVPQMLNLDRLGGIHFNKGCYPGQEIVARMHYLGKLKRRLFRLSLSGSAPPAPGTDIFSPELGTQSAGAIVNAVTIEDGRIDLLAVVQISSAEANTLHLGEPQGPLLHIEDIPNTDPM